MAARLGFAAVAAIGLWVPAFGLPIPGSCTGTGAVAGAAPEPPSPSCSSDLRECLHLKARTGEFGVRYVTADDVAACMELFNACIHGTMRAGSNPPVTTSAGTGTKTATLPKRFGINHGEGAVSDCRVAGDSVTCTANWKTANDTYSAEFTGTVSGMTMTGTTTTHRTGNTPADPGCIIDETYSGPVTYTFTPDGSTTFTAGPNQRQTSLRGSCSGSSSGTTDVMKATATWSATQ